MKRFLIVLLLFSSPVLAETNDLDKTFLDIALSCKTFRIFDSADKSQEIDVLSFSIQQL